LQDTPLKTWKLACHKNEIIGVDIFGNMNGVECAISLNPDICAKSENDKGSLSRQKA
jgi:hypothetical protein